MAAEPERRGDGIRKRAAGGWSERLVHGALVACAAVSIATMAGILTILISEGSEFFAEVPLSDFLGSTEWTPLFSDAKFGIWPLLFGTLLTSLIAIAVAVPFGLLAAIYLSEFAPDRARRVLKPALEVLAGIPTLVYGYFALVVVTPFLQSFVPGLSGFNALGPGIVMGIMIIPMISSLTEDALHAVPMSLREGAWALGATRLSTIFRVVLPSAASGIGAAVILAVSRAIGETMIVTIAAGQQPRMTLDPRVPIETMTAFIVQISQGDVPAGTLAYKTIFAVGLALFVMTFVMNVVARRLTRRSRLGVGV